MRYFRNILTIFTLLISFNLSRGQENIAKQILELNKSIQKGDSTFESYNKLGELYYNEFLEYSGESGFTPELFNKSILNFEKSIKSNPKYAQPYLNLGIAYSDHGEFQNAIRYLTKALELHIPNPEKAHYHLGLTYSMWYARQLGKTNHKEILKYFHNSIAHYLKSAELVPNDWRIYDNLGHQYYQKYLFDYLVESIDSSILYYEKSVLINPKNYLSYFYLGKSYGQKGDIDKVVFNYENSVNLSIETDAFYYLIFLYKDKGLYKKAIETYERLLPAPPKAQFVNIYPVLADIYELNGDSNASEKYRQIHMQLKSKLD